MAFYQYLQQNKQNLMKWALMFVLGLLALAQFAPFFTVLTLSAIFACALHPYSHYLSEKTFLKRHSHWAIFLIFVAFLIVPLGLFCFRIYTYVKETSGDKSIDKVFSKFQNSQDMIFSVIDPVLKRFHIQITEQMKSTMDQGLTQIAKLASDLLGHIVAEIPQIGFLTFIFLLGLYYFLAQAQSIKNLFLNSKLLQSNEAKKLIKAISGSSHSAVLITLLIGGIQAAIVAIGSAVFHAGEFIIIFIVTFFLSFIPIVGASPVALVLALYKLIVGENGDATGLLVVAVVSGTLDNILRPYLVSNSEEAHIHPVLALVAILGSIELLGFPGLFIGPMVLQVAAQYFNKLKPLQNSALILTQNDSHEGFIKPDLLNPRKISEQL